MPHHCRIWLGGRQIINSIHHRQFNAWLPSKLRHIGLPNKLAALWQRTWHWWWLCRDLLFSLKHDDISSIQREGCCQEHNVPCIFFHSFAFSVSMQETRFNPQVISYLNGISPTKMQWNFWLVHTNIIWCTNVALHFFWSIFISFIIFFFILCIFFLYFILCFVEKLHPIYWFCFCLSISHT